MERVDFSIIFCRKLYSIDAIGETLRSMDDLGAWRRIDCRCDPESVTKQVGLDSILLLQLPYKVHNWIANKVVWVANLINAKGHAT